MVGAHVAVPPQRGERAIRRPAVPVGNGPRTRRPAYERDVMNVAAGKGPRDGAAAFYADAGVMLRDQERYAQDSRKAQSEIDSKKQTLADARQKLEDLQEQARKAGISASQLD